MIQFIFETGLHKTIAFMWGNWQGESTAVQNWLSVSSRLDLKGKMRPRRYFWLTETSKLSGLWGKNDEMCLVVRDSIYFWFISWTGIGCYWKLRRSSVTWSSLRSVSDCIDNDSEQPTFILILTMFSISTQCNSSRMNCVTSDFSAQLIKNVNHSAGNSQVSRTPPRQSWTRVRQRLSLGLEKESARRSGDGSFQPEWTWEFLVGSTVRGFG